MARDPLDALTRLRRLEVGEARRRVAGQAGQAVAAAARAAATTRALQSEHPADADAWRRWLPRGLAERDRAALLEHHATTRLAEAQAGLAACRAAERAVELLREQRAAAARCLALRRDQARLDDAAQRRRKPE